MKENILTKIKVFINEGDDTSEMLEKLFKPLVDMDNVYSYLIYSVYKENFTGWDVEFLVSQDDTYNTLNIDDTVLQIVRTIKQDKKENKHEYIIGYKQPDVEILCRLFDPLMQKLAIKIHKKWQKYEYEDLLQICRLTMCMLCKKGYYINKRLLEQAFYNNFLKTIRKDRYAPTMISLEGECFTGSSNQSGDFDKITMADCIPDVNLIYEKQDEEDEEEYQQILASERELIISMIGERQYSQLLREYGNKTTTNAGRKQVAKLKEKVNIKGGLNVTQ